MFYFGFIGFVISMLLLFALNNSELRPIVDRVLPSDSVEEPILNNSPTGYTYTPSDKGSIFHPDKKYNFYMASEAVVLPKRYRYVIIKER